MELSRRGLFGSMLGLPLLALPVKTEARETPVADTDAAELLDQITQVEKRRFKMDERTRRMFDAVRREVGYETTADWFQHMRVEAVDSKYVTVSFPIKFQCVWVKSHYLQDMQNAAFVAFPQSRGYVKVSQREL